MPKVERIEAFINRVLSNAHAEAIEEFYHEDATMQENQSAPRGPRNVLVHGERKTLARHKSVDTKMIGPYFISGEHVVIRWVFRFTRPDDTVMTIEELAYQTWRDDRIATERFYYDPAQLRA
jgi:hypothetical protein